MLKKEQVKSLDLPQKIDTKICRLVDSALIWIANNTTISVDTEKLEDIPSNVWLFINKYIEIMDLPVGISSESISGLSQSFDTKDKEDMILSIAYSTLGEENITAGKVTFVSATKRWK